MKIVIVGDTHFGVNNGLGRKKSEGGHTRLDDFSETFNKIIDYCIENDVDALVQTGDLFEARTPSQEDIMAVDKAFRRLSANGITTVAIMGNHDYSKVQTSLKSTLRLLSSRNYDKVRLYEDPQIISVGTSYDPVNLMLLPYRDKKYYPGSTNEEASIEFSKEIEELLETRDKTAPTLAVGHNFFWEGSYKKYSGEIMIKPDVFKDCVGVLMGHEHNFKILKEEPFVCYTGSMDRQNFGDKNKNYFFIEYDSILQKFTKIPTPTIDLHDETIDLQKSDHESILKDLKKKVNEYDLTDSIVRFTFLIPEKLNEFIKVPSVEKLIYSRGAKFVSKIIKQPIKERFVRNLDINKNLTDYQKFKKFIDDQGYDDADKTSILKFAKEIIEEA